MTSDYISGLGRYAIRHRKYNKSGGADGCYDDYMLQTQEIKNDENRQCGEDALQYVMPPKLPEFSIYFFERFPHVLTSIEYIYADGHICKIIPMSLILFP